MSEIHPIQIEIYRNLFASIAEEMGTVLKRTSYSPNIKERRDYSCALFDRKGEVIAMGAHMPVHLGSMPLSVKAALDAFPLNPGDVVILNDPFAGGTHLPDITMIAPVFSPSAGDDPVFFVGSRAHHSDVGGMVPGSMPLSQEIFQEGVRIPPLKLYESGLLNRGMLSLLLFNVRTPVEREGDLAAQVGSLRVGDRRLLELLERNGLEEVQNSIEALHLYAEKTMRNVISSIPDGVYQAEEFLDDDGVETSKNSSVRLKARLDVGGDQLSIDFSGTDGQVQGCVNAVEAITLSAIFYVLRCLAPDDIPTSAGLMRPLRVTIPEGSVLNATYPSPTAGGNVETAQRIVDLLLRALGEAIPDRIPAASSGTMNNVSIGGIHPSSGQPFTYYETIGGGMGASPERDGDSGIHTHMTNSLNTPIEALERYYPIRVREYRLRQNSGGKGKRRGGDGIVRSLEMLADCHVTVLSERRKYSPYGLNGGESGRKGVNFLQPPKGRRKRLKGKESIRLKRGESLIVETPGGGGWGKAE